MPTMDINKRVVNYDWYIWLIRQQWIMIDIYCNFVTLFTEPWWNDPAEDKSTELDPNSKSEWAI